MNLPEARQQRLFALVEEHFSKHPTDPHHSIDHISRVVSWVMLLSEKEKADASITIPAAILHDIAIPEYGNEAHARKGAEMCRPFLKRCGYSESEIFRISKAILMHSADDSKSPESIEAKVLFDADKLDAVGPSSLNRWLFEYQKKGCSNENMPRKALKHLERWKLRYGNPPFFTPTAKSIGKKRYVWLIGVLKDIEKDFRKTKI